MITSKQYDELCVMIANYRDAVDALHTAAADDKLWAAGQFAAADRELSDYVKGLAEPVKEAADSDGWIDWNGGYDAPVGDGVAVEVMFRGGHTLVERHPEDLNWGPLASRNAIVAYRVVSE